MITVSHPNVNQYVRALLTALEQQHLLRRFHTTLAIGRRSLAGVSGVRQHPFRELLRVASERLHFGSFIEHETGWASIDSVARNFDRQVARDLAGSRAVYAYEDSALETFRAARKLGLRCFYELPILYWQQARKLLQEEAARYPEWRATLQATQDSDRKLQRKAEELALADLVVCPSHQVRESLPDPSVGLLAPYGCPAPPVRGRGPRIRGPLKVLFVGTLSQRKGLADLFAALRILKRSDVEIRAVGSPVVPLSFYRRQLPGLVYLRPRTNREVKQLMLESDLLVLPSIVEGRAMVQLEALSCGLPIIVTPNAGAEDLVKSGENGFLVPIRQPEALAERIGWVADHRPWLLGASEKARETAQQTGWINYTEPILQRIRDQLGIDAVKS